MVKLVLDTNYLLPLFGIDVQLKLSLEELLREFKPVYYNPVSLIEAKWVGLKLARKAVVDLRLFRSRYVLGLKALRGDKRFRATPLTTPAMERFISRLQDMGVTDYFDQLIAATAISGRAKLLTEDEDLKHALRRHGYDEVLYEPTG